MRKNPFTLIIATITILYYCVFFSVPILTKAGAILTLFLIIPATWLGDLLVYRGYVTDSEVYDWLVQEGNEAIRLNQLQPKILSLGTIDLNNPFIAPHPFCIIGKYYLDRQGIIPRWSKSHRLIKQYYKQAKAQQNG